MNKFPRKAGVVVPVPEEDAAIDAGIAADPDTREITASDAARLQPLRKAGRPKAENLKVPMTMRLDADVLEAIRASGAGWQTRVNDVLRDAVRRGKLTG